MAERAKIALLALLAIGASGMGELSCDCQPGAWLFTNGSLMWLPWLLTLWKLDSKEEHSKPSLGNYILPLNSIDQNRSEKCVLVT